MAWVPLESNPEVMNKLMRHFGVPEKWQVVDVYGLDSEMLAIVPQPVLAVLLLFPTDFENTLFEEGNDKKNENVIFIKQFINNACGTIALIHSILNNTDKIELEDGPLKQYYENVKSLNPEEAGTLLLNSDALAAIHDSVAQEGQTQALPADANTDHHFVAFVHKDGKLYELDGRKKCPLLVGDTTEDTLLQDAAKEIQKYIARDPSSISFTVCALTGPD